MITGKDSWKYLVMSFIVLFITIPSGCMAITYGDAGKVFGALNIALGIFYVARTYLKARDKE